MGVRGCLGILVNGVILCAVAAAAPPGMSFVNPTKRAYQDELVRLKVPVLRPGETFVVRQDGVEVPYQVEERDGEHWAWVCADFEPGVRKTYEIVSGKPVPVKPRVTVRREGTVCVLDNGIISVKVPIEAGGGTPGPIAGIKLGERWVGGSAWKTAFPLRKFTPTVIGDGTLFGKVRLRYDFDGKAGLGRDIDAFAEIEVSLGPSWSHVEIRERHEMGRGDGWELEASRGWAPTQGVSKPFSGGAGSGKVISKVEPNRDLKPGGLPLARPDLYIQLLPRWNQHYRDGWYFAATDGNSYVGAVAVRASQWVWPHSNAIEAIVKSSGASAILRAPTWKGQRLWWLFGPDRAPAEIGYVARHAWEGLDKLNHEFILDWPGQKGMFAGMNFYDGNQMNPTSAIRGIGRRALANADKPGDYAALTRAQVMFHPDAYGSYHSYWSPENPNFFTDFFRVPIALTATLKTHPRFEELRRLAESRLREDMEHSITLPGGAGQECPGYVGYALRNWTELAEVCRKHLGFDPTRWERYQAAQYFQERITQPDGDVRRQLPMGDTHPSKTGGGPAIVTVPAAEVRKFRTEELPGFGVIFTSNPGTPKETYLAFKSGPNRGHYHGDQLAFHCCVQAKPAAVDHHCSYHPRAGQEHMHNRLAFATDELPFANMDGWERLIAFKTSASADVAIGQVDSERLRQVEKLPPELWHQEYPQHRFARPLVYRRTVVLLKGGPQDCFILRDQFEASEKLAATFCLHVRSDRIARKGAMVDFGNLTLCCVQPAQFAFEPFPWSHENGGLESTQGARLTVKADRGEFVTVLYPGRPPEITPVPGGVKVGADEVLFAGDLSGGGDGTTVVTVKRAGREVLALTAKEIDLDRSQGDVGLCVPDAGYPFGEIPDWLIRQRIRKRR